MEAGTLERNDARTRFEHLRYRQPEPQYNFEHFKTKHLWIDAQATMEVRGVMPGTLAPDFELPSIDGTRLRLSDLPDKPVLLHFGSAT
jgi:hypothetical protein